MNPARGERIIDLHAELVRLLWDERPATEKEDDFARIAKALHAEYEAANRDAFTAAHRLGWDAGFDEGWDAGLGRGAGLTEDEVSSLKLDTSGVARSDGTSGGPLVH